MKKKWILSGVAAVVMGMLSSCVDPNYGGGYGSGAYPRNAAEAAVPVVVGAALIGAIVSNNKSKRRNYYHGGNQYDYRNYGAAYGHCPNHY